MTDISPNPSAASRQIFIIESCKIMVTVLVLLDACRSFSSETGSPAGQDDSLERLSHYQTRVRE